MSMTRNEAISYLSQIYVNTYSERYRDALGVALFALRHVSREQELEAENMELKERIINWRKYMAPTREQVEKVWRGEWILELVGEYKHLKEYHCSECGYQLPLNPTKIPIFCENCGSPLTDEAVEMVMERLEALKDADD